MSEEFTTALVSALEARMGSGEQCKVELKTSTRGVDVTVVAYGDTLATDMANAGNLAIAEYRRLVKELNAESMAAWAAEAAKRR